MFDYFQKAKTLEIKASVLTGKKGEAAPRSPLKGRGPRAMLDMLILNVALGLYLMRGPISFDLAFKEARAAVLDGAGQWVGERIAAGV